MIIDFDVNGEETLGKECSAVANRHSPKVLFVTSEITGLLKVGGLGEISAYLPQMLRRQGLDVRILIPGYRSIVSRFPNMPLVAELPASHDVPKCKIGKLCSTDGLVLYAVICPDLYDRDGSPYADSDGVEWADNDIRFARLGLAAAEIGASGIPGCQWRPDLLHVNDWPSALAPAYLAWRGCPTPSILTVHNLAYQGLFDQQRCPSLGIPDAAFQTNGVEFLRQGIVPEGRADLFLACDDGESDLCP
jgi:starch synthase